MLVETRPPTGGARPLQLVAMNRNGMTGLVVWQVPVAMPAGIATRGG